MKQAILLLLLLVLVRTAVAQTESDSVKYHFPIMTVTGTRYAEPWITVPLSLSTVSVSELPKGKGYGLDEALKGIPGVLVQSRFGNQDVRLTIRGFGARGAGERSNAGTSRGVRILTDGFPETEPDGRTSFDLIDLGGLGRIEIIRSNASSVYGNASGGVVNIMSNTMFEKPYSSYSQVFGSFGFHKEMINAGANLGNGKMYFSLSNINWDGWRYHSRSTQMLMNTGITAQMGEKTNLSVHLSGTSNLFKIPGPLSQAQYDSLAEQADSIYIKRDERRFNRLGRIGVSLLHELDGSSMLSASAFIQPKYLQRSERNTYRDFNRYHVGGNAMYRLTTQFEDNLKNVLLLGIDEAYQDGAILFYTLSSSAQRALPLKDDKREGANNFGAYGQDEFSIGDNVIVLAGVRYDNITYYSESYINLKLSEVKSFERWTPKIGLTYMISPTQSIYVNRGGGVEVPAGNETDPVSTYGLDTIYSINPLLEPIYSTTYEVGTKQFLTFGENDPFAYLTYDIAAYWLRVSNDIVPYRNGRFYETAGRTERMGIEIGASLHMTNGLSANVALTFSDNKYKEYKVDSSLYSPSKQGIYADYADHKVVGVPDIFYNFGLKYSPDGFYGTFVRVDLQSVGEYYADDANTLTVPAYTILNAGLGIDRFTFADDKFTISAYVGINNIADEKYIGSAWLNPDYVSGKPVYIEPGLPRNVVGSISLGMDF